MNLLTSQIQIKRRWRRDWIRVRPPSQIQIQKHYLKKPDSEIDPGLLPRSERALTIMNDHLSQRQYFVSERLSLADIALVAYTRFSHHAGIDLARWPHVQGWVARIEDDLNIEHLR